MGLAGDRRYVPARPADFGRLALQKTSPFANKYGHFTADGSEYIIKRPDTPKPWVNVICPGDYGLVVSQTGGGYSWRTHASLNRLTRWNQDLVSDDWGKYLYIRDETTGKFWSATWKPVCQKPDFYECRHGFGYTRFLCRNAGIQTELTLFVPPGKPLEVWHLRLRNLSGKPRRLTLWTYLEWCLGEAPDSHREFHRTFIETAPVANGLIATKRLWTIQNEKGQHWNSSWPYVAFHTADAPLRAWSGHKEAFIGRYRNAGHPIALLTGRYEGETTGKWDDGIGSLCIAVRLPAHETKVVTFKLGMAQTKREAAQLAKQSFELAGVREFWRELLAGTFVETPDAAFNLLANQWLKYQAISARSWARTGYWQSGGAFGYRDQLQDSQIFLHNEPDRTRRQILLHAAHQFASGSVYHWWHPLTEKGWKSGYSDDLLWLPFVTLNYLKETGDFAILDERVAFLDDKKPASLHEHCVRAIDYSLKRRSPRGLPLIGHGDWNDGLAVVGWQDKGESVWVGHFLYGILNDFARVTSDPKRAARYRREAGQLRAAINRHGWDGQWYWAARCDDGALVGSRTSRAGKIHLNLQTWAVLNGVVTPERLPVLLRSVEKHLYGNFGALLLAPAYATVDERIGYLTRYAPGVRENGGTYTHAATWAIMMECLLKRPAHAWRLFQGICPPERGKNPDHYAVEPYVTPGNVDGPDSPHYGRGGWTWYTGSAAWLYRVMTEWICGVRPTWDGLLIDPCLPPHWNGFRMRRRWRGRDYDIEVRRHGAIRIDGQIAASNLIRPPAASRLESRRS